jgi:hypothetical protein
METIISILSVVIAALTTWIAYKTYQLQKRRQKRIAK